MKAKINIQTVQAIVSTLNQGIHNEWQLKAAKETTTKALADLHDSGQAAEVVRQVMEQAILQNLAKVVTGPDGKRNDTTSNWKRNLALSFNKAYDNEPTTLTIKTTGKGEQRTVTLEYAAKVATSDRDKFAKRVSNLLDAVNPTQVERDSLTASILGLYDHELARLDEAKAQAETLKQEAAANAAAAVTARVTAALKQAGIKPTEEAIKVAVAMGA